MGIRPSGLGDRDIALQYEEVKYAESGDSRFPFDEPFGESLTRPFRTIGSDLCTTDPCLDFAFGTAILLRLRPETFGLRLLVLDRPSPLVSSSFSFSIDFCGLIRFDDDRVTGGKY